MSIKDEAHPNSLKTNENNTVLILVSYYNKTNLKICKKNSFEREHFTEVSVKNDNSHFRMKSSSLSFKRTLVDTNPITASKLTIKRYHRFKVTLYLDFYTSLLF